LIEGSAVHKIDAGTKTFHYNDGMISGGRHEGGKSMPGFVENAKGAVSIVRDGLITIILIMLLMMPKTVNESLVSAGFVEANFAGMQWKKKAEANLEDNSNKLTEATTTITSLQDQLKKTQDALNESENARQQLASQVTAEMPGTTAADMAASAPAAESKQIVEQNRVLLDRSEAHSRVLRKQIELNRNLLATVKAVPGN
jgi:septal ring factor EnvC (AmiA/AmiB activator)